MLDSTNAKISTQSIAQIIKSALISFKKDLISEPLFVFSSEIEKNSWIEWAIKNSDESGVCAIDTEQFIAWDQFKAEYIAPSDKTKNCVPAIIRKFFAQKILKECKLKKIISLSSENENSIFTFTDWLSQILPSLALWKKHYENDYKKNIERTMQTKSQNNEENEDLLTIYEKYLELLGDDFYEPSYANINFSSRNRKIYIFYPSILQDFSEYIDSLSNSADVTFVELPEDQSNLTKLCINYPDARKEIRHLALKIRKLHDEGVDLRRIAINVPDLENIKPYIEREFNLYEIPYIVRSGISYTKNCGGDVFSKIKDCIDSNYSLDAIRNLLLDGFIPWKNTNINLKLIQIGVKKRLICSPSKNEDVWLNSLDEDDCKKEKEYYSTLKKALLQFANAKSFKDLRFAWLSFSKEFINEEEYEKENYDLTNKILGRIITELSEFEQIEENFYKSRSKDDFSLNNYLDFFVNELEQKTYTPNSKEYGVNILPYKIAACADFDYHFIINANQNDITIPLKTLSFITDNEKRDLFGLTINEENNKSKIIKLTEDASSNFIALYNAQYRQTEKKVFWSSSKINFNGAAITHTALQEINYEETEEFKELEKIDFIKNHETNYFSQWQKDSFEKWADRNTFNPMESNKISKKLEDKINSMNIDAKTGFVKISASSLNSFFPCAKKWLYQNVMGIDDEKYSAKLSNPNEIGNLYHKILELMFADLKGKNLPEYNEEDYSTANTLVKKYIDKAFEELKSSDLLQSKFSSKILNEQKTIIEQTITKFIMQFCKKPDDEFSANGNYGGFKVEETEKKLFFYDEENKILLNGKIDCILSNGIENGFVNTIIVDYKTGKMPSAAESTTDSATNKIENFQMAMYVKLLENAKNEQGLPYKVQNALFYSLQNYGKSFNFEYVIDTKTSSRGKKVDRKNFFTTEQTFNEYTKIYRDKIKNKDFSISSRYEEINYVNPYSDCEICRFKSCCRTTFNIARKE